MSHCHSERPISEIIADYDRVERKYQGKYIVEMILAEYDYNQLPEVIQRMFQKWTKCGNKKPGFYGGRCEQITIKCRHPLCPRCNSWMKKKTAKLIAKKMRKIAKANVKSEHLSYLTINGPKLLLGNDFKPCLEKMKRKIRYRFIDKLTGIVFMGEFEIAPQLDETTGQALGKLHVHGWCFHPNHSADEILHELKIAFPNHLAVHFGEPHENKEIYENIEDASEYACDTDLDIDTTKFGNLTPSVLLNLLISIESIRPRGRMGLRFEVGVRTALKEYERQKHVLKLRLLNARFKRLLLELPAIHWEIGQNPVGADPPVQNSDTENQNKPAQEVLIEPETPNSDQKTDRVISVGLQRLRQKLKDRAATDELAA